MSTKTYAKLLESQGYFLEAVDVYKKLLKKNPNDMEIRKILKKYKDVNLKVLEYFTRMEDEKDYEKLERWLCKWN
jgi:tetratricopeptide (TPR) repeat protein